MNRILTAVGCALLSTIACAAPGGGTDPEPLKIVRITPHGDDVPAATQIVFQFDRPVVALGRMDRAAASIPVSTTPALACEWRWLDTSALACQLRADDVMMEATHYTLVMNPGIESEDGAMLAAPVRHTFTTARPQVTYTRFVNWLSPGTPLIQVTFNQPVTLRSVERAMKFTTPSGTVPLVAFPDDQQRRAPFWSMAEVEATAPLVDDRHTRIEDDEARRVWVVEPRVELPWDAAASLAIEPGLRSGAGPEPGIERRVVVTFDTYPEFRFLGIRCTPKGAAEPRDFSLSELPAAANPAEPKQKCAPMKPIALLFSAPVLNSALKRHVEFAPRLDAGRKDYDPWQNARDWTELEVPHRKDRVYMRWLPELLQADRRYRVAVDAGKLTDEFGRRLAEPVDFAFLTSHREPNLRLAHRNAVLEKGIDSDVPLYVTNLDAVEVRYAKLKSLHEAQGLAVTLPVAPAEDIAYAMPMTVRRLLDDESGAIFARLRPRPKPPDWDRDPEILAQVTPYQIHYKLGHFNSLAWITDFAHGEPVAGARVSLHSGSTASLPSLKALPYSGVSDSEGLVELPGLEIIDPDLKLVWGSEDQRLFAKVEKDGDVALLPIDYDYAIRGNGVYASLQRRGGHTHAWGTTAQGIYKLGDTIEYKIYVRDQSNRHWQAPQAAYYALKLYDPKGNLVFDDKEVVLNEFGAFDGAFAIPSEGAVGWYRFQLEVRDDPAATYPRFTRQPLSVLVSDFTPSPFKVSTELTGNRYGPDDKVTIDALATLHAGGPFTGAEVRLTARLSTRSFTSDDPRAAGFTFGADSGVRLDESARRLFDVRGTLDDTGAYENGFVMPDNDIYCGTLTVEAAVKDDRGKFIAASASAEYVGRDRFVGLKNTRWLHQQGQPARLEALVVDVEGKPVANAPIAIVINHRKVRAARVKGPGNAYLTENIVEWTAESTCQLTTHGAEVSICQFVPQHAGYYQFVAATIDAAGRAHQTVLTGWVTGAGAVVWDGSNDATLQIVAEKNEFRIGETARYLIKNPYPGAKALVSVERYGVLDSWIETLATGTPVVEVPIKPDYVPGFYLSVVVVSPRVAAPPPRGQVDLGKPGYRLGYVGATVNDPERQLAIDVTTPRAVYKPREKVQAAIAVKPRAGEPIGPVEIAVAVVDEAVLAMNRSGTAYYDPYRGFNRLDALDVNNYSLMSRLVGRQKFEKKGANPGGGGGGADPQLRNLFKFVSYWNPAIRADGDGRAAIEFEVPDNLTGWRILALGVTKNDRFGLGEANVKVNRPTEIRPLMPNQLIEGDTFKAGFSVMNRTPETRELEFSIDVAGPLRADSPQSAHYTLSLAPYQRERVFMPLATTGPGVLRFVARGGDPSDSDAIEHRVPVRPRRGLETAATYGATTDSRTTIPVDIPQGIHTDVGSIGAVLAPSVIGNVTGAFEYIRDYPHLCWEQRVSKALVAASYLGLKSYVGDAVRWPHPEHDVEKMLAAAANFQAPNGGMAYWVAHNRYVSPYLSAYTALAFDWLRRAGYAVPEAVASKLEDYLLAMLREDVFPSFYTKGMASSVRAVALAALAPGGGIDADDVDRYARHVAEMDLFGKAHFLRAALNTAGVRQGIVEETLARILAHANTSGGKFQFSEPWDDSYSYVLATPLRANCAVLSSLLTAQQQGSRTDIADIPFKLVRSITQSRGRRDHFENTQENVFCLNALTDYAASYERDAPNMKVHVALDEEAIGDATFTARAERGIEIARPLRPDDPGRKASLTIDKAGTGRLYYAARLAYGLEQDNAERINSGIEIRREYSVERDGRLQLLQSPMAVRRGELVRVDLFVSVPSARHFVVVDDPVPGGLEPVNTDLATSSTVDADKAAFEAAAGSWFYEFSDWSQFGRYFYSFYHQELKHDAARFYADYLPAGNYHLSYAAQAIAEGQFTVMPSSAEEMYDPDVYGKGLPASLRIGE